MGIGSILGTLGLVVLGTGAVAEDAQPAPGVLVAVGVAVHSAWDNTWAEAPFERGAMSIVATERGDMRTFRIVPCHNGIVCAGNAQGRHGRVEMRGDVMVVSGLYGRTFYLERGGDGQVERRGHAVALAWDSDVVLVGSD